MRQMTDLEKQAAANFLSELLWQDYILSMLMVVEEANRESVFENFIENA